MVEHASPLDLARLHEGRKIRYPTQALPQMGGAVDAEDQAQVFRSEPADTCTADVDPDAPTPQRGEIPTKPERTLRHRPLQVHLLLRVVVDELELLLDLDETIELPTWKLRLRDVTASTKHL